MPARRSIARGFALAICAALLAQTVGVALAAFGGQTSNDGNSIKAADDFRPPLVTDVAVGKTAGSATGFVKQGGGYHVYANVNADTGNPASGIASVTADVRNLTTGATAVSLVAGTYSAGGVSYGYRSATALTANPVLTEGAKSFTVTATDAAANANSANGSATVDNTVPLAADVQTTNAGAAGLAEQGDTLRLTFSEPIEPQSIQTGWDGTATNIVVRLIDNSLLGIGLNNDTVQLYDLTNATALPLGVVDLGRTDYASGLVGGTVTYGVGATPSTMTLAGSTLTVTLGTYAAPGGLTPPARTTAAGTGTMAWTPVATPYDRAQNQLSTTAATESGAADRDF